MMPHAGPQDEGQVPSPRQLINVRHHQSPVDILYDDIVPLRSQLTLEPDQQWVARNPNAAHLAHGKVVRFMSYRRSQVGLVFFREEIKCSIQPLGEQREQGTPVIRTQVSYERDAR